LVPSYTRSSLRHGTAAVERGTADRSSEGFGTLVIEASNPELRGITELMVLFRF
jgi:hypothetical protein